MHEIFILSHVYASFTLYSDGRFKYKKEDAKNFFFKYLKERLEILT